MEPAIWLCLLPPLGSAASHFLSVSVTAPAEFSGSCELKVSQMMLAEITWYKILIIYFNILVQRGTPCRLFTICLYFSTLIFIKVIRA